LNNFNFIQITILDSSAMSHVSSTTLPAGGHDSLNCFLIIHIVAQTSHMLSWNPRSWHLSHDNMRSTGVLKNPNPKP
jgi:hypothetical protein